MNEYRRWADFLHASQLHVPPLPKLAVNKLPGVKDYEPGAVVEKDVFWSVLDGVNFAGMKVSNITYFDAPSITI